MNGHELNRFKSLLEEKLASLSRDLKDRKTIAIEQTPEAVEQMVLSTQREFAMVQLDRSSRLAREISAALGRIADGSYGVCESCEEGIRPNRLIAVPWTRYCVVCQEMLDGGPRNVGPAYRMGMAA